MTTIHNHIAVQGRLHGDDEDHIRLYEQMTVEQARQQFIDDVREDNGMSDYDEEEGNVYIINVLTSTAPIVIEE